MSYYLRYSEKTRVGGEIADPRAKPVDLTEEQEKAIDSLLEEGIVCPDWVPDGLTYSCPGCSACDPADRFGAGVEEFVRGVVQKVILELCK